MRQYHCVFRYWQSRSCQRWVVSISKILFSWWRGHSKVEELSLGTLHKSSKCRVYLCLRNFLCLTLQVQCLVLLTRLCQKKSLFAVPCQRNIIRKTRYVNGAHGTSHEYVAHEAATTFWAKLLRRVEPNTVTGNKTMPWSLMRFLSWHCISTPCHVEPRSGHWSCNYSLSHETYRWF